MYFFNLSLNEPSLRAIVFTDDRNEMVNTNLFLDESPFEVVVFIDDGNENGIEPIEIREA